MNKKYERPLGWTTIEESRRLVEAGLNPETADMHYTLSEDESYYILYADNEVAHDSIRIVPCWSLGALLRLMPEIHGERPKLDTSSISTDKYYVEYPYHERTKDVWYSTDLCSTPIWAACDMILWLLRNGFSEASHD